jgi:hypothetical protein
MISIAYSLAFLPLPRRGRTGEAAGPVWGSPSPFCKPLNDWLAKGILGDGLHCFRLASNGGPPLF